MSDVITRKVIANEDDLNRDPISGSAGAHPLGSGAGATTGGIAGGIVGMAVAGPIGSVIGVAVGAVAGGLAGKSAAEMINPTAEEAYWRETFLREPYYVAGRTFEYYAPGFRIGWEGRVRQDGRSFEGTEAELRADYNLTKSELDPDWRDIRPAAHAAWDRVDHSWNAKG